MKLHRHLVDAIASTVHEIFAEGHKADQVITRQLRDNRKWGSRDRRFFAEATYEIVRWWRRLWFALNQAPNLDQQQIFLLVGAWLNLTESDLPPWPEWRNLVRDEIRQRYFGAENVADRESLADWLLARLQTELPKNWIEVVSALNQPAPVFLRVSRLKTSRETLQTRLGTEGIITQLAGESDALMLNERKNVFQSPAFHEGLFEVQDLHSQMVAPFTQVEPGQRVIDACAGAGGKTLHLAALMQNRGRLLAMDIHGHKLQELQRRARRGSLDCIETRVIESTKVIKRLHESADRVLLDVPCSGLGVLRRNPDAKWKIRPEEIERLNQVQRDILARYSAMTKVGGKLVYATCSILPSENQHQVEAFLAAHQGWALEAEQTLWPAAQAGDGFYMARLIRNA